jgi:hypothetical protein
MSYFFEAGSNKWSLDTPLNDLYQEELSTLKGLAASLHRMQEAFILDEKRR